MNTSNLVTTNNITINSPAMVTTKEIIDAISKAFPKKGKNDFLPSDVKEVIMNTDAVVVVLFNGKKGVAHFSPEDTYDPFVGFCIAYYRAKMNKAGRLKDALTGCVNAALKHGYKNAILRNYDEVKTGTSTAKYATGGLIKTQDIAKMWR